MRKKIVIFSQESDHTTSDIIGWLNYFQHESVIRINVDDANFKIVSINSKTLILRTSFGVNEIRKSDLVWFRRTPGKKVHLVDVNKHVDDFDLQLGIFKNLEKESILESSYFWILRNCKTIANPFKSTISKIYTLLLAEELDIEVPKWIVCNSKKDLIRFALKNEKIVQKTFNHFNYRNKNTQESYFFYTKLIEDIDSEYSSKFDNSFFQEYIEKKYEIRSFLWNNRFYSMGIFSQNDDKTRVDFRNYNVQKPNRRVPIKLPSSYADKLKKLLFKLELDTCSIDILVTKDNKFVFLEINPIGQFGMVSYPCNYNLEKTIAKDLIKLSDNE